MKGDFTRLTYDPRKHYSRVLMQQGRVQLDADWNEQADILLNLLRTATVDLVGPFAGPRGRVGFRIETEDGEDFTIGAGSYYVGGILCVNEPGMDADGNQRVVSYMSQDDYPEPPPLPEALPYLVYLDVWERHITHLEDPLIREVALGGPDTTTRTKVVWQVKAEPDVSACPEQDAWDALVTRWQPASRGLLRAGVQEFDPTGEEPCAISPDSRYRGAENQLYRVEIHQSGALGEATFKWSRENGSVVFPILALTSGGEPPATEVRLEHLGRDSRFSLTEGDLVEVVDDRLALHNQPGPLLKVIAVDPLEYRVTLEGTIAEDWGQLSAYHPLLRRWDYQPGDPALGYPVIAADRALLVAEGEDLLLEDGIVIQFAPPRDGQHSYRSGDYWLIPARVATGDVEWPGESDNPDALPPFGVEHSYAPLAVVAMGGDQQVVVSNCRRQFLRLWEPAAD
jgi:hypothetical protein